LVCTHGAQLLFLEGLMVAQKCGREGRLESESVGPFTVFMIQQKCPGVRGFVEWSNLHSGRPGEAVSITDLCNELVTVGLWQYDAESECYSVAGFKELQESDSAERVRRHRSQKKAHSVTFKSDVTECNVTSNADAVTSALLEPLRNGVERREKTLDNVGAAAPTQRQSSRQMKIPDGHEIRARDILGMLWPLCEKAVGGVMTRTKWGQINKSTALDLARAGVTDKQLRVAHQRASESAGVNSVYLLDRVQKQLIKDLPEIRSLQQPAEPIAPAIAEMLGGVR
jgi:hypothetical protein